MGPVLLWVPLRLVLNLEVCALNPVQICLSVIGTKKIGHLQICIFSFFQRVYGNRIRRKVINILVYFS